MGKNLLTATLFLRKVIVLFTRLTHFDSSFTFMLCTLQALNAEYRRTVSMYRLQLLTAYQVGGVT